VGVLVRSGHVHGFLQEAAPLRPDRALLLGKRGLRGSVVVVIVVFMIADVTRSFAGPREWGPGTCSIRFSTFVTWRSSFLAHFHHMVLVLDFQCKASAASKADPRLRVSRFEGPRAASVGVLRSRVWS